MFWFYSGSFAGAQPQAIYSTVKNSTITPGNTGRVISEVEMQVGEVENITSCKISTTCDPSVAGPYDR